MDLILDICCEKMNFCADCVKIVRNMNKNM